MNTKPTADWTNFDKRPTWGFVSSPELAKVFGVSLQSINNWKLREKLPPPDTNPRFKGNKNFYRISKIRSWLEDKPEDDIHMDWIKENMSYAKSIPEAQFYAQYTWQLDGLERV